MPLIEEFYYQNIKMAVWQITETEAFFNTDFLPIKKITNNSARLRHKAAWWLAQKIAKPEVLKPAYNKLGAPIQLSNNFFISLSHSQNTVAAAFNLNATIGIDVEQHHSKAIKVQTKFINNTDLQSLNKAKLPVNATNISLIWSAKEAFYKKIATAGSSLIAFKLTNITNKEPNVYTLNMEYNNIIYNGLAKNFDGFWLTLF
jgi:4'-phosphopantetheinyl transferase EntD